MSYFLPDCRCFEIAWWQQKMVFKRNSNRQIVACDWAVCWQRHKDDEGAQFLQYLFVLTQQLIDVICFCKFLIHSAKRETALVDILQCVIGDGNVSVVVRISGLPEMTAAIYKSAKGDFGLSIRNFVKMNQMISTSMHSDVEILDTVGKTRIHCLL